MRVSIRIVHKISTNVFVFHRFSLHYPLSEWTLKKSVTSMVNTKVINPKKATAAEKRAGASNRSKSGRPSASANAAANRAATSSASNAAATPRQSLEKPPPILSPSPALQGEFPEQTPSILSPPPELRDHKEVWRSHIVTVQEQSLSVRSVVTRNRRNCWFARGHSNDWFVKSLKISNPICVSKDVPFKFYK